MTRAAGRTTLNPTPADISDALRRIGRGFWQNWGLATLSSGTTSTVVSSDAIGPDAHVLLFATTSTAIAASPPQHVQASTIGEITVTHGASTATDMTVLYLVLQ